MNSQVWWFVARSSGIVAWALLSASVIWGLLLSTKVSTTRIAARRLRPAWLLDLHRHLGGLAVFFTAIHVIGIVADSYVTFGWAEVLVPMASEWRPGAVAFGIVAMYLLIAIEATSLAIRRLPRSMWRWVHRSSFVLYGTATWHGIAAGTDADNPWFQIASWVSIVLVVALTIRLVVVTRRASARVTSPVEEIPVEEILVDEIPAPVPTVVSLPAPPAVPAPAAVAVPPVLAPPAVVAPPPPLPLVPMRAGIAPLPGSMSEMMMPPASIPPPPQRPPVRTSLPPPSRSNPLAPPPPSAPRRPPAPEPLGAGVPDDRDHQLVVVSPGGSDASGLAPPTTGT
ncbi:MAG TPA: ferric reductase-like transmembrane domain-containing protein [Ilumatobacteraceae bacterium]|nr:ferric reductase-like transmembrane domain-containing protein [Ilumatobacteraceae bacterium]